MTREFDILSSIRARAILAARMMDQLLATVSLSPDSCWKRAASPKALLSVAERISERHASQM